MIVDASVFLLHKYSDAGDSCSRRCSRGSILSLARIFGRFKLALANLRERIRVARM